jgi:hypothetical protein
MSAVFSPHLGVEISDIQPFTQELGETIEIMKVKLVNETKLLEGMEVPEYGKGEWAIENGLSDTTQNTSQWKSASENGCSTTDPIHILITDSNILSSFARPLNRDSPTLYSNDTYSPSSTESCSAKSDDCGKETDAMNESCECTVPTISARMDGTPSEAR